MLKKILDIKYCLIFLITGLTVFFYKSALSGFDLLPGDNIDSRYINYILEHFWLWCHQIPPHNELWNMPMLYPAKNTLAYSDVLFGIGIIYIPVRFFTNAYNSFLITVFVMCALNFITFYFLLKKCFNFKDLSSAFGAYFYAFSVIKYAQLCHVQLLSQFYTILALICFIKSKHNKYLSFIGCFFVALQFCTSFYMGWFIAFSIFIVAIILPLFKTERRIVFEYMKQNYLFIVLNLLFTLATLSPLIIHYLKVGVNKFPYESIIQDLFPSIKNLFLNYSFIDKLLFAPPANYNSDTIIGVGIITTVLVLISITHVKKYRNIIILFTVLVYSIMTIPFLHKLVYDYFPAGSVIRAVGRCINILCPLFAVLLANFVEKTDKNIIKTAFILILIIEQFSVNSFFGYSKKEAIRDIAKYDVPKTCHVIFMDYSKIPQENHLLLDKIEMDGIWLALNHRIYTVNGYGGVFPGRQSIKLRPECIIKLKD